MKLSPEAPSIHRVRKGFDDQGPELSVPATELDALHPAHREDVLNLMARFAVGVHLDEGDIAYLFRTEGMTLTVPGTGNVGPVEITNILGEIVLIGAPEDVAALQ